MAANTVASNTGVVTGADPSFALTYKSINPIGVILMIKYTKGTENNVTLTFDSLNPSLHATDKYRHTVLSTEALSALTMVLSATGNYRIPLSMIASETSIIANIVFAAAAQGGVVVANFVEA